ncbi:hypothetical protein DXG01_011557 [Tephrocybe rancida]|nr:hypothetical protein DXG01_011557 [Tephrocybe rancida]
MAPQQSKKKSKVALSGVNLMKFEAGPRTASSQRFDPLTAFKSQSSSQKSATSLNLSQRPTELLMGSQSRKGKGKAMESSYVESESMGDNSDDRMWVDIYEPTTEGELAVHKRKVEDLRRWLQEAFEGGPSGNLKKYRRILALTGPAGTAKTTTVRVLAREMGFDIMEWKNAVGESNKSMFADDSNDTSSSSGSYNASGEALFAKFKAFLNRALSCDNLFTAPVSNDTQGASQAFPSTGPTHKRHIILLEDLPNLLHASTQSQFHAALEALVTLPVTNPPVPVIIVVSDAGVRGEVADERMTNGGGWGKAKEGIVDIRTVLPRNLLGGSYVTEIGFNPIAPTLLMKGLQALLQTHFSTSSRSPPSREVLDAIVESANGDIRSAIMALQFACIVELSGETRKKKGGEKGRTVVLESVTRREQSLMLFHLLGRVLYNKRKCVIAPFQFPRLTCLIFSGKGDPSSSSATAKDVQKEKLSDAQLKDPPKLLPDFHKHDRRASRIDVDSLYADSPIDSSLFSLYIHQNYPQFCDDIEQCDGVADWLSWVDSSGGDAWYQANPHQFHLLTLGTIHSLPSPVTRRSQKITKPLFFECLQSEKTAWEGVRDARGWALGDGTGQTEQRSGWSHAQVAVELGGVLKARDHASTEPSLRPPHSHRLFSTLKFALGASFGVAQNLDEKEVDISRADGEDDGSVRPLRRDMEAEGGWLDSDDIEDF